MGTIDFQQPIVSTTKTNMKLSLLPPSSSPAYSLSQNLKPKLMPSHGWLTLTWDMPDCHTPLDMLPTQPPMDLDTTDTLLDTLELTSSEREKLTPKPSHGWPMLTPDMLDTHTPPPMVPTLTHPSTTLPTLAQSPPMLELTSSAREKLKPTPGTDIPDTLPHTPPM